MVVVAPRVGAWIETRVAFVSVVSALSPLAWGRGLKLLFAFVAYCAYASPLAWGRGLKRAWSIASAAKIRRPSRGGVD